MNQTLRSCEAQCSDVRSVKCIGGVKVAHAIACAQGEPVECITALEVTAVRLPRVAGCVDTLEKHSRGTDALSEVAVGDEVEAGDIEHPEAVRGPGIDFVF